MHGPDTAPMLLFAALPLALAATTPTRAADDPPPGKIRTDRSIVLKTVVEATPDEVYELWTTAEGLERFFATEAEVEAREGGKYHVFFLPRSHPDSEANSSTGARILRLAPGRSLSFEWTAPPFAAELNQEPLPLWVDVQLTPLPGERARTIVELANHGYGRGGSWDRVYEFFVRNWSEVLYRLDRVLVDPDFLPTWPGG